MDGFVQVKRKGRRKQSNEEYDPSSPVYFSKLVKKVETIEEQFNDDPQLLLAFSALNKALDLLEKAHSDVTQIICYGLGGPSSSYSALYQLALIRKMSSRTNSQLFFFDPVFNEVDIKLLEHLKCVVLREDDRGNRVVDGLTLFYLPHAPRFIMNNICKSNWGAGLSNCLVLGNNLQTIYENTPSRVLKASQPYLFESSHFVEVITVDNNFRYNEVFNDFAFHIFTPSKLDAVDQNTWDHSQVDSKK